MNKKNLVATLLALALITALVVFFWPKKIPRTNTQPPVPVAFDPLNAKYIIENVPVTFVKGTSLDNTATIFGVPTMGDLNGDALADAAFIITKNSSGSGTFFYVAAAINTTTGAVGTNTMLLGDRISPQNVEIQNKQIIVNFADRKPGEPMTARPSVGVSKYFTVTGNTVSEVHLFSQVTNRAWKWVDTKMSNGTTIVPKSTSAFTVTFKEDKTVSGTTDCNGFGGGYTSVDGKLVFGSLASTLMYCNDSQETDFLKGITAVESYMLTTDNKLILQLKMDSGTMIFE